MKPFAPPSASVRSMAALLELIRSGEASTKPELVRQSQLARNVVTDRIERLQDMGLVRDGAFGRSTGGRAPRSLELVRDAGYVFAAQLGATWLEVGVADLSGTLLSSKALPIDVRDGPTATLQTVHDELAQLGAGHDGNFWGLGIGLPGPVEWESGKLFAPPIMPGWDGFDVRAYLQERFGCPVWVDNDVNMMAVGEMRAGVAQGQENAVYVKVGTGIGAGLISRSRLHRGAQGAAGDIGHISVAAGSDALCRCGNHGCLEAVAGGGALVSALGEASANPLSTVLKKMCDKHGHSVEALVAAAQFGDPVALRLLADSARTVGGVLAQVVNLLNPAMIVLGGRVGRSGDLYLSTLRQAILKRSLPLATRSLEVITSPLGDEAGLVGAAFSAVDQLLSAEGLARMQVATGAPERKGA